MAARGGNANAAGGAGGGGNNAAAGGGGGGMNEHVEFTVKVRQATSAVQNTNCRFWFRGPEKNGCWFVRSGFLVGEGWRRRTGPRDQRTTTVI